jgi:serine/threonine-protein kinase
MGEVFRALDAKLDREVAIKVLPDLFAGDPERLARFEREAKTLAALNHPGIAQIYGVEESDGVRALVMELVEGPTLDEWIRGRGSGRWGRRSSIADVIALARQIADALDAAHERGIVHRDLKPANIKVRADGTVKVLDFGLAKAWRPAAGPPLDSGATTVAGPEATREGVILGTAAYMSPEQARGRAVDERTDLWAFGCVLYEMLTGRAPFQADTGPDTLAAILTREPEWSLLPANTPPPIRRLLRRCLERDPKRRWRSAADARIELEETTAVEGGDRAAGNEGLTRRSRRPSWRLAAVGLIITAGAGGAIWRLTRGAVEPPPAVTRLTVPLPATQRLDSDDGAAPLALSADGRRLAYVAHGEGGTLLYLRELDAFEARPMAGTEGARYPFFSPDGQWVAFFAGGRLKRVPIAGGAPLPVCDAPRVAGGGTWGRDGTIVFAAGDSGLLRVAARGGNPEPVATEGLGPDAVAFRWPRFLPDGRALLATLADESAGRYTETLGTLSLETGQWTPLGRGSQARYLPSGHLVYHAPHAREGELHVVGFDLERRAVRGEAVAVLDGVFRGSGGGAAYFDLAETGTLVFAPGGLKHALVSVDRDGRRTPLSEDRLGFRFPRLSPDGRRVAVTIDPRPSQIWVYDLERRSRLPLAIEGHSITPLWTPDGRRVVYYSDPGGDLYWRAADASDAPERLLARAGAQYPMSWTRDGRSVIFTDDRTLQAGRMGVWILPLEGDARPLFEAGASLNHGLPSPDGRWLAYSSDESGRREVYVRAFPDVDAGKWAVSTDGGHSPRWSPDGRELFYMDGSTVLAVPVEAEGASFATGAPTALFSGPFDATQDSNFDVSPDGSSFVMVEADPDTRPNRLQVVLHWAEELKRLPAPGGAG